MAFNKEKKTVNKTVKIIEREVQVPIFKEVEVIKPVFVEKKIEVRIPDFKPYIVKEPVIEKEIVHVQDAVVSKKEINVEVPVYREVRIDVPKYVEKVVEVPVFVEKKVVVEKVEIKPVIKEVEVVKEVVKIIEVEKKVEIEKPIFRDVIVDIIKPKYKCQSCGKEVK